MAANPVTVTSQGREVPAPFPGEVLALRRDSVEFVIDELRTRSGKWQAKGTLWLSNVRLVVIADGGPGPDGLHSFDIPLAYITNNKFNQPVFSCNHLSGKVWPAAEGGGPAGTLPPHDYKIWFPNGGVGTLLPLFFQFVQEASRTVQQQGVPTASSAANRPSDLVATAFVDPADPSQIYLTQPLDDSDQLPSAPVYASNYGSDERYEPM